ncbi:MAG: carbamoyl-phosphate synthase large subunit [Verrucomicrobiota bacterium]|nr:carbamoyl-phosphate synthase large subunit [Verrucomicrobiota bacterium]
MPRREDIHTILLIGSGPIVIGQACEFDYSGTQACKALREEGYRVVLVNSNPATIMTDPEFADRTYIEPITLEAVERIIEKERPDVLLPTLGGQTALNLAMNLHEQGILAKYGVEMIGARADVIRKAESRDEFKRAMRAIGLGLPHSGIVTNMDEAQKVAEEIASYPLIIRPSFTLGGSGGGIAYNPEEYDRMIRRGLDLSPVRQVLVEESVVGWKEFEMEVMRDVKDNVVIICSIENLDPMGVHTGDSITVAPAQTLTDKEYQMMRDASIAVIREIGVETGGSNIQFAINPEDGRMVVIEMNPRVSRSSALASKATGYPIAKIAAKLAVGYTLDELPNDITRETPASFEPTIDYCVVKVPRFTFEKFPLADPTLTTQMKSVGEAMAIGKTFKESLQKALRSMENSRAGLGADGKAETGGPEGEPPDRDLILRRLVTPNQHRIFFLRHAYRAGMTTEEIFRLTKIDPWFLDNIRQLVEFEGELAGLGSLDALVAQPELFHEAKRFGYSDRQLAFLTGSSEAEVRSARYGLGLKPVFGLVDTCAAEFEAYTPYFYSTYGRTDEVRPSDRRKVMILGGGPNRIGQGIEFDYCCVHASFALREADFETIMVNSNPETVSTDYDTSDKLFFEPLTLEDVLHIYEREQCWGAIVQFGGQTPLNLAKGLQQAGVNIIGTSPDSIDRAEDRQRFQQMLHSLNLKQPPNGIVTNAEQAIEAAHNIGYPVLVRPSYVLGGRAMEIVFDDASLQKYMRDAVIASEDRPVLIDKFLENAIEVDVDCISDGSRVVIGAVMEHIEQAGVHSGDSACVIPPHSLSTEIVDRIREQTRAMALELGVRGLMNVQYAVQDGEVYVLEVNPRASRTIPFVSKAIGVPLAKYASLVMIGKTLDEIGFTEERVPRYYAVKEAVLPFVRFTGSDVLLGPEMRSTGEVMGIDQDLGMAFAKTQMAAGGALPDRGGVFISVRDEDKPEILTVAKTLAGLGYEIFATDGTAAYLYERGVESALLLKVSTGRPNALDLVKQGRLSMIINTPAGYGSQRDSNSIRREALYRGIPVFTTLAGAKAAANGIVAQRNRSLTVTPLQDYHANV